MSDFCQFGSRHRQFELGFLAHTRLLPLSRRLGKHLLRPAPFPRHNTVSALGQKRTCAAHKLMSALGHKQTCSKSELPTKSDFVSANRSLHRLRRSTRVEN